MLCFNHNVNYVIQKDFHWLHSVTCRILFFVYGQKEESQGEGKVEVGVKSK